MIQKLVRGGSRQWRGTLAVCCAEVEEVPARWRAPSAIAACSSGTCTVVETAAGYPLLVCVSGPGMRAAAACARHAVDVHGAAVLVSLGYCGCLPSASPSDGETVLADSVADYGGLRQRDSQPRRGTAVRWLHPPSGLLKMAKESAAATRVAVSVGRIVSDERPLHSKAFSALLAEQTGARAVDMESAAIAEVCDRSGLGWLSLRVYSDDADEQAPRRHALARRAGMPDETGAMLEDLLLRMVSSPLGEASARPDGPDGARQDLLAADYRWVAHPFDVPRSEGSRPAAIEDAWGSLVRDVRGRTYIDGMAGTKNVCLGHGHPAVMPFVSAQAYRLAHWPADGFTTRPLVEFARRLAEFLPSGLGHVMPNTGGSEAVEAALRLARDHHLIRGEGRRYRVLALSGGYHGATAGALSVSGLDAPRRGAGPLMEGVVFIPPPSSDEPDDVEAALRAADDAVATWDPGTFSSVIFEPTQGLGGIRPLPAKYLAGLMDVASDMGALAIADEIACGLARTGRWFDFTRSGKTPDIVVCGKALTNGTVPLSATVVSDSVHAIVSRGGNRALPHGHTWSGHPLAATAGSAVLKVLARCEILRWVDARCREFKSRVPPVLGQLPWIREVRCAGLWVGVEVCHPETGAPHYPMEFSRRLFARGLLHEVLGSTIALCPPLTIPQSLWEEASTILVETLGTWPVGT